jgi:hypothetical protein
MPEPGASAMPAAAVESSTAMKAAAMKAAAMEASIEIAGMKAATVEAAIIIVGKDAKPEANPYRKTVSIIGICVTIIIGRVILVLTVILIIPSLISLTIL